MKILSFVLLMLTVTSCNNVFRQRISGNGSITTQTRSVSSTDKIKCSGNYDIALTQGSPASVKIETDENLQEYIVTENDGDELSIHTRNDVNVDPSKKTKIYITTDKLEEFTLTGNGTVNTQGKFSGSDHLDLSIAGSGNMHFNVNTPKVSSSISGTGDIYITGETKDSKIEVAGSGNYHADDLKSESVTVKIAGTGDAYVFADSTLDINIAGVGNVSYKGNPSVTQNIAGTGKIKKME